MSIPIAEHIMCDDADTDSEDQADNDVFES